MSRRVCYLLEGERNGCRHSGESERTVERIGGDVAVVDFEGGEDAGADLGQIDDRVTH